MKKINEIKNEKCLTRYVEDEYGSYYEADCEKCPFNVNSCDYVCDEVLADRLAKYENIGRDFMKLPADEVVPVEVLETSLKIVSVLTIVSKKIKSRKRYLIASSER